MPWNKHKRILPQPTRQKYTRLSAAAGLYALFSIYLYKPHFETLYAIENSFPVSLALAGLGGYVLSRRWIGTFTGSFFTGWLYGFGPFMLGLAQCHPAAGVMAAMIPWLFWPAVFAFKKRRWFRVPLTLCPFAAIVLFFYLSAQYRLFAVPTQARLNSQNLVGLLTALVAARQNSGGILIGFYHVPMAAILPGTAMLLTARRYGIMVLILVPLILSLCRLIPVVSPAMWLSIPMLCVSIIAGAGLQGLVHAGRNDRQWVLAAGVFTGTLAIISLLLATKYFQVFMGLGDSYARLFADAGKMYILATVAAAIIYLIARMNRRLIILRLIVLCSALTIDLFSGTQYLFDLLL